MFCKVYFIRIKEKEDSKGGATGGLVASWLHLVPVQLGCPIISAFQASEQSSLLESKVGPHPLGVGSFPGPRPLSCTHEEVTGSSG